MGGVVTTCCIAAAAGLAPSPDAADRSAKSNAIGDIVGRTPALPTDARGYADAYASDQWIGAPFVVD